MNQQSKGVGSINGYSRCRFALSVSLVLLLLVSWGCGRERRAAVKLNTIPPPATAPATQGDPTADPGAAAPPGGEAGTEPITVLELREQLRNFADHYRVTIAYACDTIAHDTTDPLVQRRAHDFKIDGATAMYDIVIDPIPATALLNALVMSCLQAHVLDEYGLAYFGPSGERLVAASRQVEEEVWRIGARVMSVEQRQTLMGMTLKWWEDKGKPANIWYVRLEDFEATTGDPVRGMVGSLTSMPARFLDTFIPVNRAGQTLDEAQVLAERVSWMAPRLMIIAQWRAEAIVYETLATPQVRDALGVANTVANAVTLLPEQIAAEREALFESIRESQPQLSQLLADAQATIASVEGVTSDAVLLSDRSEELLASADVLMASVDRVLARVESMQAARRAAAANSPRPPSTQPARPFDITEYTEALHAAADALKQVDAVIMSAEQASTPDQLTARIEVLRDSASGLIWLAGGVLAGAGILIVLAAKLIPARRRG